MTKKQIPAKPKAALPVNPDALKKLKISLGMIVAAFAFILYAQSISFNYVLDDQTVLKDNTVTTKGLRGIPAILKTDYLYGFNNTLRGSEYRPIPLIIFAIEWQLFPGNPHFGHLINVLLYAITCFFLFIFLCKLFEKTPFFFGEGSGMRLLLPFVCTLLYAAHPIHTEVVDNIKSLDEIVCFLFALLASYFIILFIEKSSIVNLIIGMLCFFLSVLSKESGIAFLPLIPLMLYVFTKADFKKIGIITLLLALITGLIFLIRHKVFESLPENINITSSLNNILNSAPDFLTRQATAFYLLLKYLLLLILPLSLSCDYSYSQIQIQTLKDFPAIFGIIIYFALGIYAIINIKKKNYFAFSILFYLIALAPVSNVFVIIGATMAERFMYVPSLGFCMLLPLLILKFTKGDSTKNNFKTLKQTVSHYSLFFGIIFMIAGLYSIRTIARNQDWKDNYSLFSNDVNVVPNSAHIHSYLASTFLLELYPREKDANIKQEDLDKAIIEFTKAIQIFPDAPYYSYYLGMAYADKNDHQNWSNGQKVGANCAIISLLT